MPDTRTRPKCRSTIPISSTRFLLKYGIIVSGVAHHLIHEFCRLMTFSKGTAMF